MKILRSFTAALFLELRSAFRSGAFSASLALMAAAVAFLPYFLRSDGTGAGLVSLYVRVVFGAVFLVAGTAAFSLAAGSYAPARSTNRLSLDLASPLPPALGYLAKCLSISAFACALSFAGGLMAFGRLALDKSINPDGTLPRCVRAIAPSFGRTVREEAEASYEEMVSRRPESEAEAKKQKRFAENPRYLVIWALENKVRNSPEPVRSGGEYRVKFPLPEGAGPCSVRVRCPLLAGIRSTFGGEFTFGGEKSAVSSVPSTEVEIPFSHPAPDGKGEAEFVFSNNTGRMVFLRPRRDLTLLVPHGGFFANFLMAVLAWTGIVSVFSAIAAAMSSALSKPVAVFGSVALLLALLVAPVSSAQIPDPAEMSFIDIASLCVTHWLAVAIEPVASVSPAGSLAENTAIEASVLARLLLGGCLILPALLSPLAAVAARAKPQD